MSRPYISSLAPVLVFAIPCAVALALTLAVSALAPSRAHGTAAAR